MRKVVLIFAAAIFTTAFVSCKNEKSAEIYEESVPKNPAELPGEDLAIADLEIEDPSSEYLYVTAYSGLSLREFNNLHSEKLARMPYGTKVRVITSEEKPTMKIEGIQGAMDQVEFNHKKGFAFSGYLSKYFPPERDINVKGYAEALQEFFPDVKYLEEKGGTASNPSTTEGIVLPEAEWHEAFFTAQRLFDFPKEFAFPKPKGKDSEVIFDGKPKKGVWKSELQVTRKDNKLEKIEYVYDSEKYTHTVTIVQENDAMKLSKTETIK